MQTMLLSDSSKEDAFPWIVGQHETQNEYANSYSRVTNHEIVRACEVALDHNVLFTMAILRVAGFRVHSAKVRVTIHPVALAYTVPASTSAHRGSQDW